MAEVLPPNDASGTVASGGLTNVATTLNLNSGQGAGFGSSFDFRIRIEDQSDPTVYEICRVTGRSSDALTIVRGQEGTSGTAFVAGAKVAAVLTKDGLTAYVKGELDYVERTTNLAVAATSEATPDDVIVGNTITLDGSTRLRIEFWASAADSAAGQAVLCNLWDGTTDIGRIAQVSGAAAAMKGEAYVTPSAGTHTFKVRAWKTGGGATVYGGTGAASTYRPSFLRITRA